MGRSRTGGGPAANDGSLAGVNPAYPWVAERAEHRCEYGHAPELVFNFPVEHIVPLCRGGANADTHLALACRSCNLRKGVQITGVDPSSGAEIRRFNPRHDHWSDHFRADLETGDLIGLTALGRATLAALRMNNESQRTARRWWPRLWVCFPERFAPFLFGWKDHYRPRVGGTGDFGAGVTSVRAVSIPRS